MVSASPPAHPNCTFLCFSSSAFTDCHFPLGAISGSLVIGFALSLIGSTMLFIGLTSIFAILFSVGIIVSLVGTGFLVGFLKQLKMMFQPVRIVATGVLFASLAMVW